MPAWLPTPLCTVAEGRPWQVLVSQTVFSQLRAPKLCETVGLQPRLLAWICRCVWAGVAQARWPAATSHCPD